MVEPKLLLPFILLTWSHLLLLVHHCAEAQSPPKPVLRSWDPSIIFITGALIIAFVVVGVFTIYLNRCFESHMTRPNPNPADWPCSCSQGIDPRVLDTFPILFYSAIKDLKFGKEALECAVCLSEFKDDETLRLLPACNHVFHPDCIDAWLSSHVTCPVCRANLNRDSGEVAVVVETQLSNNETNDEGSGSRAPQGGGGGGGGGGENEIEQYPVAPNANEGQSQSNGDEDDVGKQNRASKLKLLRKLRRSNSTGHSLVEPGKCVERYTLRLPVDVRRYILLNHRRSESYHVVTPMLGSSRKGLCWSDSEGSSRGKRNNVVELRQERWTLSRS